MQFAGIALHTWTIDTTPLRHALAAARDAGADAVEIRNADFVRCRERGMSDTEIAGMIREAGLPVSAVGVEYGWLFAQGDELRRLFDVFRRQCDNAVALGCGLVMSGVGPHDGPLIDGVSNMRTAGEIAGQCGLRLTFEFMAQHPSINHAEIARELIARARCPNVGLLLDTYHLHHSGRPGGAIDDIPGDEIFYVQFSDVPRDVAVGAVGAVGLTDRLAPGLGAVQWREFVAALKASGYRGYLSYEAPNPIHWDDDATLVAKRGIDAMRTFIAETARI
ncbi:inosose isomerase [Variibacter gotjawalensis]|uniref:Inosose isomerase n=1 Tax=Variibacter gotjawalensis TaxID=1333996 RepID=A0A0S3PS33_9BRAD|nr:sugar phosphate isomerase/epimerase family protein [Variibacter gotjawalensis]NIK49063.1 sugar phosphate isomerase/epimerase [Variibacter gotjawalensis]RZS50919.1 sugar phosphate isomerase/epimerase [Variibacter gotjawalensis]BAT58753.1 inosose isomerase [Variibacter gotjawalensis]